MAPTWIIAGLPIALVGIAVGMLGAGAVAAYTIFPHVRSRVTRFWDGTGDNYQVTTALEAFGNGGLLGRSWRRCRCSWPDCTA